MHLDGPFAWGLMHVEDPAIYPMTWNSLDVAVYTEQHCGSDV